MSNIAVIVLNWNGKKDTLDCLKYLDKQQIDANFQVIVVDNGSADDSVTAIKKRFPDVDVISSKANLGFAQGNNIGIKFALEKGADYIVVLNNDTIQDTNLLRELQLVLEDNPKAAITVPKIYFAKGYEFHKERYKENEKGKVLWYAGGVIDWSNVVGHHRGVDEIDKGQFDKLEETEYATGCCFMIKRSVLEKVGLFDQRYFLYYEDSDLSMRVKREGFSIYFVPKAKMWHKNAGSAGGSGSTLQDYYITRNRLLFGLQYAPLRTKLSLIKESMWLLKNGRQWQKRGVLDFYLRRLGKGSYNL